MRVSSHRQPHFDLATRRPGTNHGSKKMLKTPDLGKSFFDALAINLWQKLKNWLGNIELMVK